MLMHEHGFSKRRAEKAVNAVFDGVIGALKRGEGVDLPVGRIRAVRAPANRQRSVDQKFRNIQNQVLFSRLVQHPKRIIRFSPDRKQIRHDPVASSPAPPTPQLDRQQKGLDTKQNDSDRKQNELEQMFLWLVGRQITLPDVDSLLAAVVDPNKPVVPATLRDYHDRLLARFRQLIPGRTPVFRLLLPSGRRTADLLDSEITIRKCCENEGNDPDGGAGRLTSVPPGLQARLRAEADSRMAKPTGYGRNLESMPRQAFQQAGVPGYHRSISPYRRLLAHYALFNLRLTRRPAGIGKRWGQGGIYGGNAAEVAWI